MGDDPPSLGPVGAPPLATFSSDPAVTGAMYSILVLGTIMLADSFGLPIPAWLSPVATFAIVGYFLYRSVHEQKKGAAGAA